MCFLLNIQLFPILHTHTHTHTHTESRLTPPISLNESNLSLLECQAQLMETESFTELHEHLRESLHVRVNKTVWTSLKSLSCLLLIFESSCCFVSSVSGWPVFQFTLISHHHALQLTQTVKTQIIQNHSDYTRISVTLLLLHATSYLIDKSYIWFITGTGLKK